MRAVPSPADALALPCELQQAIQPGLAAHASCPSTLVSSAGPGVLEWVTGQQGQPHVLMANWVPVTNAVSGGPTVNSVWLDVTRLVITSLPLSPK